MIKRTFLFILTLCMSLMLFMTVAIIELTDSKHDVLYIDADSYCYENENGTYGVENVANAVTKIGDKYYKTLDEALEDANSGDTITLVNDVDMSERDYEDTLDLTGITLDLGGKTWITGMFAVAGSNYEIKNGTVAPSEDMCINMLYLNALDEPVEASNIKLTDLAVNGGVVISNAKNVVVSNCNITAEYQEEVFYVDNGSTVTIDGGNYTLVNDASYLRLLNSQDSSIITVKSGSFSASKVGCMYCIKNENIHYGTVIVYGGTFNQEISEIVAEDCYCYENENGTYSVETIV